jgi:hypothetical protein
VDHVRPRSTVDRPWTAEPSSSELNLRPLRCPRAPSKGRERGSGTRGTRWSTLRQPLRPIPGHHSHGSALTAAETPPLHWRHLGGDRRPRRAVAVVPPPSRKDGRRGKPHATSPGTNSTHRSRRGREMPSPQATRVVSATRSGGGAAGKRGVGVAAARVRFHPELPGRTTRGAGGS